MTSAAFKAPDTRRNNIRSEFLSYKIEVSYLDHGFTFTDLWKLFGKFGLKTVKTHYDGSGRLLGKADITFYTAYSALKAVRWYNSIYLNSCPMKTTLDTNSSKASDGDHVCVSLMIENNRETLSETTQELCVNIRGDPRRRFPIKNTMLSSEEEIKDAQLDAFTKSNKSVDKHTPDEEDFEDVFRELETLLKS